jgi:hypothetical protein
LALSDLFSRLKRAEPDAGPGASSAPVAPTKALSRFISGLSGKSAPVLLDLGSVIGSNVSFFGERLGCKIVVEDLAKDIDRHVSERMLPELPTFFGTRIARGEESVDGVLCWDIFDYLDKASATALATSLVRVIKPEGLLLAFFNTVDPKPGAPPTPSTYTKHVVVDQASLQHRTYAAARGKQRPFQNRDIQRMFEPMRIVDQFLMKNHLREMLFRKPDAPKVPAERAGDAHDPDPQGAD